MILKNNELEVVGIRLVSEGKVKSIEKLSHPKEVVDLFLKELSGYDREVMAVFNVSAKGRVLNVNIASMGTINATLVSGREIFKSSILSNASGIILAHNHPSGDPTPSKEDLETTEKICIGGEILGIEVIDHVIVGGGMEENYHSMRKAGEMDRMGLKKTKLADLFVEQSMQEEMER